MAQHVAHHAVSGLRSVIHCKSPRHAELGPAHYVSEPRRAASTLHVAEAPGLLVGGLAARGSSPQSAQGMVESLTARCVFKSPLCPLCPGPQGSR